MQYIFRFIPAENVTPFVGANRKSVGRRLKEATFSDLDPSVHYPVHLKKVSRGAQNKFI